MLVSVLGSLTFLDGAVKKNRERAGAVKPTYLEVTGADKKILKTAHRSRGSGISIGIRSRYMKFIITAPRSRQQSLFLEGA